MTPNKHYNIKYLRKHYKIQYIEGNDEDKIYKIFLAFNIRTFFSYTEKKIKTLNNDLDKIQNKHYEINWYFKKIGMPHCYLKKIKKKNTSGWQYIFYAVDII